LKRNSPLVLFVVNGFFRLIDEQHGGISALSVPQSANLINQTSHDPRMASPIEVVHPTNAGRDAEPFTARHSGEGQDVFVCELQTKDSSREGDRGSGVGSHSKFLCVSTMPTTIVSAGTAVYFSHDEISGRKPERISVREEN
jgi:hypothetical protein